MEWPWTVEQSTGRVLSTSQPEIDTVLQSLDPAQVERFFGSPLPSDYVQLTSTGPAWSLDNELVIFSPFDPRRHLNQLHKACEMSWAIACLRAASIAPATPAAFPEPGGLLGWGADGFGNEYYWSTTGEPDSWPVVVVPHGGSLLEYELNLTGFVSALVDHRLSPWYLSSDDPWPQPGAELQPIEP